MRRGDPRVIFSFPEVPSDDDLLHPYLAPAAALAHMWAGREALHGGAFATPGGAVALLGEKHGGKSTTLAWLAAEHRVPVLSDDLVVLAGDSVLTGPRCLDLRPATSLQDIVLSGGRMVRKAERLRVTLPTAPAEAPLAATVVLRWGPHLRLEVAAPADRVRAVLAQRMYADRLAGDPSAILRLTSCPMVILTRPRGKSGLRDGALALLDYLG